MNKSYGNVILIATMCVVVFWVFMALRPAHAQGFFAGPSGSCCGQVNFGRGGTAPSPGRRTMSDARIRKLVQEINEKHRRLGRDR